uniref:Uncharacterized protein n=1 Tax=Siphoviridae sp. ctZHD14 TaxID=2827891 RepID=A0A8S5SWH7_9CAUD|nr:MAG TPA: hypothetical protein [Siphoviridae sp. ctZHD14]
MTNRLPPVVQLFLRCGTAHFIKLTTANTCLGSLRSSRADLGFCSRCSLLRGALYPRCSFIIARSVVRRNTFLKMVLSAIFGNGSISDSRPF